MAGKPPRRPRNNASAAQWENYYRLYDLWQAERDYERSQRGGSTMYDRGARSSKTPRGASGEINLHGENGVQSHGTQYYDDGYRVSRDGDGQTDTETHWTNQNVPKGQRHYDERHTPPPDAY